MSIETSKHSNGSDVFKRLILTALVLWFYVNLINFINQNFFKVILNIDNFNLSIFSIACIVAILSVFFTFFFEKAGRVIYYKRGSTLFSFLSSLQAFNTKLEVYEKFIFIFTILILFVSILTFIEVLCLYINNFFGTAVSLFALLLMTAALIYYIYLLFNSRAFLKIKTDLKNAK